MGKHHYFGVSRVKIIKEVVQLLLAHSADINSTNKFGRTILHELAMYGTDEEHYNYLVNLGANIHQKDNLGETPLHFAALSGSASDVRFLIDNGADVNAHDNQGNTPLHHVVDANFMLTAINYYLETIEELIRLGADVSAKTNDGQTPLDLTRRYDKVRRDPIANLLTVEFRARHVQVQG
jgi:ankyrin repeat protein